MTRYLYSLNLLAKLMVLHLQILFSLAISAIAEAILIRTYAEQVPCLYRVAPRYCKLYFKVVTSSTFLAVQANICTDVVRAVDRDLALFCADFHSVCLCSVFESVGATISR